MCLVPFNDIEIYLTMNDIEIDLTKYISNNRFHMFPKYLKVLGNTRCSPPRNVLTLKTETNSNIQMNEQYIRLG